MSNTPASFSYLTTYGPSRAASYSPVPSEHSLALDEEVRLYTNNKDREKYENLADLYAIIVTMEHLEKAYVRDSVTASEYTQACAQLIAQYRTALNLVCDSITDVEKFMEKFIKEYKLECPAAVNRFKIGVPATIEHPTGAGHDTSKFAQYVAETVHHLITTMDALKLGMKAVDYIHPLLGDLMQSLNKVSSLPADFEGKAKIRNWLIMLNGMKASDELNEEQVRQLSFDLESANNAFYRSLSDKN
ncbi:9979_t:CDS:2 [Funneliformis caledonium]|uniref:Vacuolar protein sorting-associated protein 28 n=2 Tax=Funneliformis TaxID=1117308 RepID=A0A9N9G1G7_9GLOM|nr:9979_t:CDS:2 [Funneliformis caledonium]CAG8600910.1 1447_t:CDS:2 [Funneliformis mosseae]